jgi:WhiB family transcriptional regulator, redox-sensing transcriptional regulator
MRSSPRTMADVTDGLRIATRSQGPILARRVPIPNRWPDIKLPEPPEFTMPPTVLKYAACATEDPELFFPDDSQASENTAPAKAVCARCPVRAQCLKWAIDNRQTHGIWGGLDESERAAVLCALDKEG